MHAGARANATDLLILVKGVIAEWLKDYIIMICVLCTTTTNYGHILKLCEIMLIIWVYMYRNYSYNLFIYKLDKFNYGSLLQFLCLQDYQET